MDIQGNNKYCITIFMVSKLLQTENRCCLHVCSFIHIFLKVSLCMHIYLHLVAIVLFKAIKKMGDLLRETLDSSIPLMDSVILESISRYLQTASQSCLLLCTAASECCLRFTTSIGPSLPVSNAQGFRLMRTLFLVVHEAISLLTGKAHDGFHRRILSPPYSSGLLI